MRAANPPPRPPSATTVCDQCGRSFASTGHRFCSFECLRLTRVGVAKCRVCSEVLKPAPTKFQGRPRRRFCGDDCYETWRRCRPWDAERRAAEYGVAFVPFDYLEVFTTAGWKCQICGRDTPPALRGTKDPRAPELDHVIPMSKGGPHVRSNVQLACMACNNRKRASLPSAVPEPVG